jgi:hypothetical protein
LAGGCQPEHISAGFLIAMTIKQRFFAPQKWGPKRLGANQDRLVGCCALFS